MSGGYGSGGYPGHGYDAPDYEEDPRGAGPRQRGGRPDRDGSVWGNDQPYEQPYQGRDPRYDQQAYRDQAYDQQGYDQHGYDQQGYQQPGYEEPGYEQRGYDDQDYRYPSSGNGYPPPASPRFEQRGGDWEQDPEDSSFLPGFGRGEPGDGYDADRGQRASRTAAAGPGGPGGPGGRGPGSGGPAGRGGADWDPADRPVPRGRGGARDDDGRGGARLDQGGDWHDDRDRAPRRRATRWVPRVFLLVVLIVVVVGGLVGGLAIYHKYQARYHPADYAGPGTGDVTVQVMSGDTAFSLAPRLVQLGVVASERAFTNAVEAASSTTAAQSTGLEAGYYVLHHHMQASLAYTALTNPKDLVQTTVTIPEGKRAVDVIAIISKRTKIPLKDFQAVLAHPSQLGLPSYANGKAEGYLFPATYAIAPHETALEILQAMVTRFNQEAVEINLVNSAKAAGLTPTQLIIEASMAQAEGGSVSDYPKIAETIHNRIAIGMHLQFDSTVLYGIGKYAVSATLKQIHTPGPYNTYLNAGLPPGPISNPGDAAIQGVLHPATGNYLYFLTFPNGKSQFSHTPLKGQ